MSFLSFGSSDVVFLSIQNSYLGVSPCAVLAHYMQLFHRIIPVGDKNMNTLPMICLMVAGMMLPLGGRPCRHRDFSCDRLGGITTHGKNLSGLSFRRMNLVQREFVAARLIEADFSHANLDRAELSGAFLWQ